MNKCYLPALALLITLHAGAQQPDKPNIIVFMVDDMGIMDTSVPFCDSLMPLNKIFRTPSMERLAREGMKFSNAYAQPVCTPTRVSYITGMNSARTRITNWTSPAKDDPTDAKDVQLLPPRWNINGWSNNSQTPRTVNAPSFPQLLKEAGYYTIHVGKAHWGSAGTPGANPYNAGFMINIAGHAAGHPQSYLAEQQYGNLSGKTQMQAVPDLEEYYQSGTFLTEALTRECLKALETPVKRKEPFFLNMAHYAVHTPIMADLRFVQKYYDAGIDSLEAQYASLVEGIDKSLGDILQFLDERGVAKNTLIIFMSDNGGLDRRGGKTNTHNRPFRSGKGSIYEGGIREPMLVKWPGIVKPGSTNNHPVIIDDFFPTILEAARIKYTGAVQTIDGLSLVPTFGNPAVKPIFERPLIFHYPNKWTQLKAEDERALGINFYSAMRLGKWKLIYNMRGRSFELYNLDNDIGETNNLAASQPARVKQLAQVMGTTLKQREAQMPVDVSSGQPVPYPDEVLF
jgi:arylsulfatase A-like enzyme